MNTQNKKYLFLIAIILNQLCQMKALPISGEEDMNNIDGISEKSLIHNKSTSNLEEMNICIDICSECFKEDMNGNDVS